MVKTVKKALRVVRRIENLVIKEITMKVNENTNNNINKVEKKTQIKENKKPIIMNFNKKKQIIIKLKKK